TQAVDFRSVPLGKCQADKAPQRNATQPDRAAAHRSCRQNELVTHAAQYGSIGQMLQVDIREDQIECQLALTDRADKSRLYEIFRAAIGGGQKDDTRAGGFSRLRRLI